MIDCRKKRDTDLWIRRVAQFCSTSIGLSLRLVGSSHAGCLHTFGLGHRQTYLKNFHVLDEEPCNIAAQTLRRPLLRPCRSDGACSLAYCRRATCPGTMKEVQGHAPAPPGSYSRSWRMPHWTFPDPRKAQGILTAPLFIQVCTRFGTRVAFASSSLRSLLQFLAVSVIAEPILLSRFEFCMCILVFRAFSVFR